MQTTLTAPSSRSPAVRVLPLLHRGSPMRMDADLISDPNDLNRLFDESERFLDEFDSPSRLNQSYHNQHSTSGSPFAMNALAAAALASPPIPRFQPAIKPVANSVVKQVIEDGLIVKDSYRTLADWKVERYIDDWTEALRRWFALHLFAPLVSRIDKVDAALAAAGLSHLSTSEAAAAFASEDVQVSSQQPSTLTNASTSNTIAAGSTGLFGSSLLSSAINPTAAPAGSLLSASSASVIPQTLQQLASRFPNDPTTKERLNLEPYLSIGKYTCRAYIIARIRALAQGSCLAQYVWNGGQSWDGRPWDHDSFPSDAALLMHLFCRYMDENIRNIEPHKKHDFTDRHFLPWGVKPTASRLASSSTTIIKIREQSRYPSHFQLVVENTIWDVYPNRNNAMHTISLFVYYVKTAYSGFVGLLNIGGRAVGLTNIIVTEPVVSRFSTTPKKLFSSQSHHKDRKTTPSSSSPLSTSFVASTPTRSSGNQSSSIMSSFSFVQSGTSASKR